jgi:hypothetical protein
MGRIATIDVLYGIRNGEGRDECRRSAEEMMPVILPASMSGMASSNDGEDGR